MVADSKPKLTSRDAIMKRATERAEGKRDPSHAFRDEVLAALVDALHDNTRQGRELLGETRAFATAANTLTLAIDSLREEIVSLNLTTRPLVSLLELRLARGTVAPTSEVVRDATQPEPKSPRPG